jgi:hypothetical protein
MVAARRYISPSIIERLISGADPPRPEPQPLARDAKEFSAELLSILHQPPIIAATAGW